MVINKASSIFIYNKFHNIIGRLYYILLSNKVKKRIKEQKFGEHTNTSKFFGDLKKHVNSALEDLSLIAEKIPEKHLTEMFTDEKLKPFFNALMKIHGKDRERTFFLGYMMLQYSLNATSAALDNKWAQKLYDQHQGPLKEILDSLYHEKKKLKR